MDIKKILLITIIAVAIVASVSAVSAGWFDGLFGGEQQDKVVEVDGLKFNTTNATDFVKSGEPSEDQGLVTTYYVSDNGKGSSAVVIFDYSKLAEQDSGVDKRIEDMMPVGMMDNYNQTVNGTVIYKSSLEHPSATDLNEIFAANVQNETLHKIVMVAAPDVNETVKMASTLKFE